MNTWKDVDAFSDDIKAKYPDYKTNQEVAKLIRSHPDFSHVTVKQSWEDNYVYFYADNTPNRVSCCLVFNKEMLPFLTDPLDIAKNVFWYQ